MHALYFDAVKRQTDRQTEGERHTELDYITYILFILSFYIDGREGERERERDREGERFMHSSYPLFVSIRDQINLVRILKSTSESPGRV